MTGEIMDLKIVRANKVYRNVPLEQIERWIAEKRVTPDDLVRPVGGRNWLKVSLAPELADSGKPLTKRRATAPTADEDLGIDAPARSRRRTPLQVLEDSPMDLTPMIDVTFQLLIFFMFSNQLANPSPILVPEAQYGRGVTPEGMQVILIDQDSRYFLGESTKEENVSPSLEALTREVADNASMAEGPLDVIISAHKESPHHALRQLVDQLSQVDNVGTIRLGVEERQ